MNKNKLKPILLGITGITTFSQAANTKVVPDQVMLETNPDVLISKTILRSEILNEMEYRLKLQKFLRSQKEEELKYKKLTLEEYKLQLEKEKLKVEEKNLDKVNAQLNFDIAKLKERMELLKEFPYTTLGFKPNKIDLIRNILIANQEEAKRKKVKMLKNINQQNLITLKKQYIILQKFEKNFNSLYENLVSGNYEKAINYYDKINELSSMLLGTNILYMQDEFSKFRMQIIKLNSLLEELLAAKIEKNLELAKAKYKEVIEQYQSIIETYYKIRDSLLNKIISLQQINQNEFQLLEILQKNQHVNVPVSNTTKEKSNKKRKNNLSKVLGVVKTNINMKKEEIIDRLSIEFQVPKEYLKYLTPEDIEKLDILISKIKLYKNLLYKIESGKIKKYNLKEIAKILGSKDTNSNYLYQLLLKKLENLIKQEYNIVTNSIKKYKEEKAKELAKLKKLKELEKLKQLQLERKRKLEELRKKQEMERRKRQLEELRKKQEMEKRKKELELARKRKEQEIKKKFYSLMSKFKYIGLINNNLVVQSVLTGKIYYLKVGSKIGQYKIININLNTGKVEFYDTINNKKFVYNFITPSNYSQTTVSGETNNNTGNNLFNF